MIIIVCKANKLMICTKHNDGAVRCGGHQLNNDCLRQLCRSFSYSVEVYNLYSERPWWRLLNLMFEKARLVLSGWMDGFVAIARLVSYSAILLQFDNTID